jgi:hypothetical protein
MVFGTYGGKKVDPNRKLWKEQLEEGMKQGKIPVPQKSNMSYEDATWSPHFTTRDAYKFGTRPKYREMYWKTHQGMNPEEYQQAGLESKEDWLRMTDPQINEPERELPPGAQSWDAYGNAYYGGKSHHEEFMLRSRAQIQADIEANKTGEWDPKFRYTNPEVKFKAGEEGEGIDPNSLAGMAIAAKHIASVNLPEMLENAGEVGSQAWDWVLGRGGADPEAYGQARNWWLENIQRHYSKGVGWGENKIRYGMTFANVALIRTATGKSMAELTEEGLKEADNLTLTPNQQLQVGDNAYMRMMANRDQRQVWGDLFDMGVWNEIKNDADAVQHVYYGNMWDGLAEAYSGIQGAVAGTEFKGTNENTMRMAEMVNFAKENPETDWYAKSRDLNNPTGDMVGRAIGDPLNFVTFGTTKVFKAMSFYRAAMKAGRLMGVIEDVVDGARLTKAQRLGQAFSKMPEGVQASRAVRKLLEGAEHVDELTEAVMQGQRITEAAYVVDKTQEANPLKWLKALVSPSTSAKVQNFATDIQHVVHWTARAVGRTATGELDYDDFYETLKWVAKLNSKNADEVTEAMSYLSKRGNLAQLLSEQGMRGVYGLAEMTGEFTQLGRTFKKSTEGLKGMELLAKVTEVADMHAFKMADRMYPTLNKMVKAGEKLPFGLRAVEKVDTFWKEKPGKFMHWFFGTTQLGLNPGYAVRNGVQNLVQSVFDEGIEVITANKKAKSQEAFAWMGLTLDEAGLAKAPKGVQNTYMADMIVNYNKEMTSMTAFQKTKRFIGIKGEDFRDISAKLERYSGTAIFNKVVPEAMKQALRKNTRKLIVKSIAGFDADLAVDAERILIRTQGNVRQTMTELRDYVNSGTRRVVGSENLPHALREEMHTYVGETRWREWTDSSETVEEAIAKIEKWEEQTKKNISDDLKNEVVTAVQDGNLDDVHSGWTNGAIGDAVMDGTLKFDEGQEFLSYHNANTFVGDEIDKVLQDIQVQFELGLGRKSTTRTRRIFDSAIKRIELKIPDRFGGGSMTGYEYLKNRKFGGYASTADRHIQTKFSSLIQEAEVASPDELLSIYRKGGLEARHGKMGSLRKGDVIEKLKDELFKQTQEMWQDWRNANYMMALQFTDETSLAARALNIPAWNADKKMIRASNALDVAKQFDKHLPVRWVEKDLRFARKLIKRGDKARGYKEAVLAWARQYGYATGQRGKAGSLVKLDKHIANILNSELGTSFDDLSDLTSVQLDELRDALLYHSVGIARDALADPVETVGLLQKLADGETLTDVERMRRNHMLDVLDEVAPEFSERLHMMLYRYELATEASDKAKIGAEIEKASDAARNILLHQTELPSARTLTQMNLTEWGKTVERLKKIDADKANELDDALRAFRKNKGDRALEEAYEAARVGMEEALFDITKTADDFEPSVTEELMERVIKRENIKEPPKVYGGEHAPQSARAMQENWSGVERMNENLKDFLRENWDEVKVGEFADKKKTLEQLDELEVLLDDTMDSTRHAVREYAEATRDFILHDYGKQKNFDLLLAYIYPYSYWYTRTYANWMQRVLRNPGAVQAYYDYKRWLANKNQDLPEYMRNNQQITGLFGIPLKHPLFINGEAWVNPLNAILAPDFNDAQKRSTQFGRAMDNWGKFGPSVHQLYGIIYGATRYAAGEKEEGAKWIGRLLGSGSRAARVLTKFAGLKPEGFEGGVEVDPFLIAQSLAEGRQWWQGMDPYEKGKVARAGLGMVERGQIDEAKFVDAMNEGWENADFQMMVAQARSNKDAGDLLSFVGSPAFRSRTKEDMQADAMNLEVERIFAKRDIMDEDAWAQEWATFNKKFPHADLMTLARSTGNKRDERLTYNVLSRIPAGAKREFYERAGLDYDTVQEFYKTKGKNLEEMTKEQHDEFMNGVIGLSMTLAVPDDATRQEWKVAGQSYGFVMDQLTENYGEEIMALEGTYWKHINSGEREKAYELMDQVPELQQMMNDKTLMLNNDHLLRKYYSTYGQGKSMYNSRMWEELGQRFPNIEVEQQAFFDARAQGKKVKASDNLKAYWEAKGALEEHFENLLLTWGQTLPDGPSVNFRTDYPEERLTRTAEDIVGAGDFDKQNVPEYMNYKWQDWAGRMSPALQRVISDWAFRGASLTEGAESSLEYAIKDLNISLPMARDLIRQSLDEYGAEFYGEDNPPGSEQAEDIGSY